MVYDKQEQEAPGVSNRILYIVSLNHFINDGSTGLISSLFPAVILAFGFSNFQVGVLVAVGYLVNMIFQPLTGRYSERFESRKLLVLGISLVAVSMILFTVSSTFGFMLISVLILRFGSSFFHPVGVSTVSRAYSGRRLDSSMGFQSAFGNLGIVLVFVLSAPIYLAFGWRAPFLIFAALDLMTVLITLFAMREKTVRDLRSISEESLRKSAATIAGTYEEKHTFGLPWFFLLAAVVSGGSFAVLSNFGNLLLYQRGFGLSGSNFLMAFFVVSAFFGALITGWLTKKLTRDRLLPLSFLLAGLAAFAFALFPQNGVIIVASLLLNGFALSITYPAIYSELSAYLGADSKKKGASFGVLFSSQIAGSSVLGFVSGYLAGVFGLELPFEIVGSMLIGATILTLVWIKSRPTYGSFVYPNKA